jgi:bilin biosynthesis protein
MILGLLLFALMPGMPGRCSPTSSDCDCSDIAPFMRAPADPRATRLVASMSGLDKRAALNAGDSELRRAALRAVAAGNPALELTAVLNAARDASCDVAVVAVELLENVSDQRATLELLRAASSGACRVREAAVWSLEGHHGADVSSVLLVAIRDRDARVRHAAATSLGAQRDTRAAVALIEAAADTDKHVRQAAVTSLGKIGDRRGLRAVLNATRDSSKHVRQAAAYALANLR